MKLECSGCSTRYTIDDTIIPPLGAKVRCKKCGTVIHVPATAGASDRVVPAPTSTPIVPPSPAPSPPPVSFTSPEESPLPPVLYTAPSTPPVAPPARGGSDGFSFFPNEGPGSVPVPGFAPRSAPAPMPAPPAPAPTPTPSAPSAFAPTAVPDSLSPEEKKQHEKARRLARVLASD